MCGTSTAPANLKATFAAPSAHASNARSFGTQFDKAFTHPRTRFAPIVLIIHYSCTYSACTRINKPPTRPRSASSPAPRGFAACSAAPMARGRGRARGAASAAALCVCRRIVVRLIGHIAKACPCRARAQGRPKACEGRAGQTKPGLTLPLRAVARASEPYTRHFDTSARRRSERLAGRPHFFPKSVTGWGEEAFNPPQPGPATGLAIFAL